MRNVRPDLFVLLKGHAGQNLTTLSVLSVKSLLAGRARADATNMLNVKDP